MRKWMIYMLIALITLAAAYYAYTHYASSTLTAPDTQFAITDTAKIASVTLSDKKARTVTLTRAPGGWRVDRRYKAQNYKINLLLSTLRNIEIRYPVMQPAYDNVVKQMAASSIKVEIRDADKNTIRAFYIGGPDLSNMGTFTKMEGSRHIYATDILGFEGYLTTRFLPDEQDWRDRHVFNIPAPEIRRMVVAFTAHADSSFQVDVAGPDSFRLYNYKQQEVPASKQKVMLYLMKIGQVQEEAIINESPARDTTIQKKPFCIVTIVDATGHTQISRFYRKGVTNKTQEHFDPKTNLPVPYDMDRALGLINHDSDFVLLQYRNINYLMPHLQNLMLINK